MNEVGTVTEYGHKYHTSKTYRFINAGRTFEFVIYDNMFLFFVKNAP